MHYPSAKLRYATVVQLAVGALLALVLLNSSSASLFTRWGEHSARPGTSDAPGAVLKEIPLGMSVVASTGALQVAPSARQLGVQSPAAAFDALNRRAGGSLEVRWDATTGIPRFLAADNSSARIPYTPTAAERGNPLAIARGFLDENRTLFRLDAVAADFGPARVEPDPQRDFSHVRLPQVYKGVPVFGRQMVVHVDPQERIVAVSGHFAPDLNIPTEASITKEQAEEVALDDLKVNQLDKDESARVKTDVLEERTALTVFIDAKGKPTLTWRVKMLTTSPLGEWTFFVNARRPIVTHAFDGIDHAKLRQTYASRTGADIPGRLLAEEGERTSDEIGQAAHDGAGKVYDYYFGAFERDGIDGRGSPMVSTVHFGTDPSEAENAAWIAEAFQMVYGDGGEIFEPLAYGLDVVGHEFTHGVIDSTAQLVYEGQSGALNESYADIFAAMIDRDDWTLGEDIVKSPPFPLRYLRSLEDPEAEGTYDPDNPLTGVGQPGHMDNYANLPLSRRADNGGVHINSGIPNHAAFFLAQAIGREKTEQIYYRALTQYLSPTSDFFDAGLATVQAATDLYGQTEADAVRSAFNQVGIDLGGPETTPPPPAPGGTATATPRPAPTAPAEPLPEGCRDVIVNGSFESDSGWVEVTTRNTELIDPQLPRTGSRSAWLGGTDKEALQYIYQDLLVPANATSVRLSYYRLIHEEFSGLFGLLAEDANFAVLLADAEGREIERLEELSSAQGDDTWRQAQFDISRLAGDGVRLVFAAENPPGNVSSFFVDDVAMAVCTGGGGPSAPPTSSEDQVYLEGLIVNADTGRGVSGAEMFVLRPGLTASAAAADDELTEDEVVTFGITDRRGYYMTEDPITRNETYSAIIVADGYYPVLADDELVLPADAENPTQVDAMMRSAR